jgi:hypothetical protein
MNAQKPGMNNPALVGKLNKFSLESYKEGSYPEIWMYIPTYGTTNLHIKCEDPVQLVSPIRMTKVYNGSNILYSGKPKHYVTIVDAKPGWYGIQVKNYSTLSIKEISIEISLVQEGKRKNRPWNGTYGPGKARSEDLIPGSRFPFRNHWAAISKNPDQYLLDMTEKGIVYPLFKYDLVNEVYNVSGSGENIIISQDSKSCLYDCVCVQPPCGNLCNKKNPLHAGCGHCHDYSVASLFTDEPQHATLYKNVRFEIDDQKALLTMINWNYTTVDWWGDMAEDEKQDNTPEEFFNILSYHYYRNNNGPQDDVGIVVDNGMMFAHYSYNVPLYYYKSIFSQGNKNQLTKVDVTTTLVMSDYLHEVPQPDNAPPYKEQKKVLGSILYFDSFGNPLVKSGRWYHGDTFKLPNIFHVVQYIKPTSTTFGTYGVKLDIVKKIINAQTAP